MKIEMIKGAANPKPNDFMILTIAEISNIRSENAKLLEIVETAIDWLKIGNLHQKHTAKILMNRLNQLKEDMK